VLGQRHAQAAGDQHEQHADIGRRPVEVRQELEEPVFQAAPRRSDLRPSLSVSERRMQLQRFSDWCLLICQTRNSRNGPLASRSRSARSCARASVSFKAVRGCVFFISSKTEREICKSSTSVVATAESTCSPSTRSDIPPTVSPAVTSPSGSPPSRGT